MILHTTAVDQIYLTLSKASDTVLHRKSLAEIVKMDIITGTGIWQTSLNER